MSSSKRYNHSVGSRQPLWEAKLPADIESPERRATDWQPHLAMMTTVPVCLAVGTFVCVLTVCLRRSLPFEAAINDASFAGGLTFGVAIIASAALAVIDFSPFFAPRKKIVEVDDDEAGPEITHLEVTIPKQSGTRRCLLDLPVPDYALRTFATAAVNGLPISERRWTGSGPDKIAPKDYRAMRDQFIDRGLAEWISPYVHRLGWRFTEDGRAAMEEIAES